MSSTHDSMTYDICFDSSPLTISVGSGEDGRDALLVPVELFVVIFVVGGADIGLSRDIAFELASLLIANASKRLVDPGGSGGSGFCVMIGGFSNESMTGRL